MDPAQALRLSVNGRFEQIATSPLLRSATLPLPQGVALGNALQRPFRLRVGRAGDGAGLLVEPAPEFGIPFTSLIAANVAPVTARANRNCSPSRQSREHSSGSAVPGVVAAFRQVRRSYVLKRSDLREAIRC